VATVEANRAQGWLAIAAGSFLHAVSQFPDCFQARMGADAAIRRVPFDALEVNDAFPGLVLANLRPGPGTRGTWRPRSAMAR
jgi:hypothetical protein